MAVNVMRGSVRVCGRVCGTGFGSVCGSVCGTSGVRAWIRSIIRTLQAVCLHGVSLQCAECAEVCGSMLRIHRVSAVCGLRGLYKARTSAHTPRMLG